MENIEGVLVVLFLINANPYYNILSKFCIHLCYIWIKRMIQRKELNEK